MVEVIRGIGESVAILQRIKSPADLRELSPEELTELSQEIREFLVAEVSRTGGHLGPNLGVVELTLALHRVFESPRDPILWDTGHQSYVHKIVTGRAGDFATLRKEGGLSGYPSRDESEHDFIENSHASTALSYADGLAKAFQIQGEVDRHVVAVVGDGALTGGMTWEAINNIADDTTRSVVIVVNDNERSYSPTIGGLANHLATLRTTRSYERFLDWGKSVLEKTPVVGGPMYDALHGMKKGIKDMVAPQGMFEDLGLKYIGPIDGHNIQDLEFAFQRARDFGSPVIVHVITEKGRGYAPAEMDEADRFHAVGVVDPDTGKPITAAARTWTSEFSEELVAIGDTHPEVVAITAAMLAPTGLDGFKERFPTRTFDVGIAEQHAITSAVGMATAGLHPVVAIYSTFLNRAFDQVVMDCALHKAGVTIVLDRAGITGDDGASHNGMWDLSIMRVVPGLQLAAPRDGLQLRYALQRAVTITDGPSVVRFPKGNLPDPVTAIRTESYGDVLFETENPEITIVSIGGLVAEVMSAAQMLSSQGLRVRVIDPVWALPVAPELISELANASIVVTVEDGLVDGGIGEAIGAALHNGESTASVLCLGVPKKFLPHAKRVKLIHQLGLDGSGIALSVSDRVRAIVR